MISGGNSNLYTIGIYVRESRDENEENYDTIETQRDLLIDFVHKNKLGEIYKVYIDDNESGSRFQRRGIEELRADITAGRINMVLLKDLSRLGRNNAKTLLFLDFLEEYGIRVLTFDGRYDSQKDNDTVGIETWFNERYIRDISKKIRANLRFKIEKGEYIGHAPYGYMKLPEEKNKLFINEETAPVVREIFKLYKDGYGYTHIAKQLNTKGYPAPSYRSKAPSGLSSWNQVAVRRILCNRAYIGDTVQGVSEKVSFKSKKTRRLPDNRWVITCSTHEAIISREEFEEVQKIRIAKKKDRGQHKGVLHTFKGLLRCGRCGGTLLARSRKNRPMGYICSNYAIYGAKNCSSHYINEHYLKDLLLEELKGILQIPGILERTALRISNELTNRDECVRELNRLEQQVAAKQKQQDILYFDRLEGKISEQLFIRMNATIENRISQLRHEIEKQKCCRDEDNNAEEVLEQQIGFIMENGVTRTVVEQMVDKIVIYDPEDEIPVCGLDHPALEQAKTNGLAVICFKFDREDVEKA